MKQKYPCGNEVGPELGESWIENRLLIEHRLDTLTDSVKDLMVQNRIDHERVIEQLSGVKEEITTLKTKASVYGAVAGFGGAVAMLVLNLFFQK